MQYQEWHTKTEEKQRWGDGPWCMEPDKAQWADPATGLPCLIVRNQFGNLCGYVGVAPDHPLFGVAYAACPVNCPASEEDKAQAPERWAQWQAETGMPLPEDAIARCGEMVHCDHTPETILRAHGGITFADACMGDEHDPSRGICHRPDPGEEAHVWWFGFDCAHGFDLTPAHHSLMRDLYARLPTMGQPLSGGRDSMESMQTYRDWAYVQEEIAGLAAQLQAIATEGLPGWEAIRQRVAENPERLTLTELLSAALAAPARGPHHRRLEAIE